jgi:hypothetical protein
MAKTVGVIHKAITLRKSNFEPIVAKLSEESRTVAGQRAQHAPQSLVQAGT